MNRRTFVKALVSLPVAWSVQPWIGAAGHAGGVYTPLPENLRDYLQFYPILEMANSTAVYQRAVCYVAWAPLGARHAEVQMFGCHHAHLQNRRPTEADVEAGCRNILCSVRAMWEEEHSPGWLRTVRSQCGPEGEFSYATEWCRVGYVAWVKPSDVRRGPILVEAA